ncbi:maleylpyruvate isomerase family mycothiol-dependent enzyme [Pseudonocardia sp. KRD-184]|uniref:Maleylpyruvate isomerase family mycothiol-dependent enzyme n=1 Tax=Pseudonocardia oceani TaxID=2792013 RepID=A0ABS6UCS1_9PSEU|nr:maleylpyruvate isomerase family mycothiol-dependent enzyme [Pseudonocardia oceani]MBW0097550.1 maleylpyruvate isomerase family mycothiol-dependent enzyme [Pseudonocardia oceani]MBW0110163.1 maleylpyruvate isomerase family mycothiol-dependent enzyme [Pseudonocardia oceani]MBW0123561.1 maleylpyruvate isomerase family mycothiol-dependent enzyme [Pseudonocardia oceani]MBW0129701.1 maleylpyruvate isomerase family mycothiol-dependent enzyme [Pseudonocardia oceani]
MARSGDAVPQSREALWALVHEERAALADDLAGLAPEQWPAPSLCGEWSVEEVVAHLTAAASVGRFRWIRSMVGARFDADLHNRRRLAEHRGATPDETLARFRAAVPSTTAPSGHTPAWLGEVVVHAQDVRRPLGLPRTPSVAAATEVARFFASRDFTVNSRTAVAGLRLEAVDGPFATGDGPLVRGTTLVLVMAMAGRTAYLDDLDGAGVNELRSRIA